MTPTGTKARQNVKIESFENINSYWLNRQLPLRWESVFNIPPWLEVWWSEFGNAFRLHLCSINEGNELIGIAPLFMNGSTASFIGSADVCDYQDFIISPGKEQDFFNALLNHLTEQGVSTLDLRALRPESSALTHLADIAQSRGAEVSCEPDGVTFEIDLPSTWEDYLQLLKGKQRHEVKRKLRRLHEAAEINYRVVEDFETVKSEMDTFLGLFRESRNDKTIFMTARMESFFRSLVLALSEIGILKLCFLDLDGQPAAAVLCFEYNDTLYLYNNGYDPKYRSLSAGVLCKVLSIKNSIEKGMKKYDFLKGAEIYKHRLGGREVHLSRCQIKLK
ncbi:MAG: GNAT family N-acetyltransferase [Deltaproteobacteria bacterium]|nr:GNAT family N-acetyltransferase [Deltaproteobacteria bacterium]MBW2141412.1 GNAT family N-acetyltransferase [Deltaproteobacteria bacterium]